jgi:hypothetical protein
MVALQMLTVAKLYRRTNPVTGRDSLVGQTGKLKFTLTKSWEGNQPVWELKMGPADLPGHRPDKRQRELFRESDVL